jgi:aspartyl-tRNA(Asn)/glutamyl-tRNA(Gln) amidotransferase subunit C
MSVDDALVRRVARLARVAVAEDEVPKLREELSAILSFVEELGTVDVDGVEPMTSVMPMALAQRDDVVTAGGDAGQVLGNAPASELGFFVVPKVVE